MGKTASLANIGTIADSSLGFRNRIINGAMVIDQRNAGASVTVDGAALYTVDRWQAHDVTDGVYTAQQSSTAPANFVKSLLLTVTTADTSIGASQYAFLTQPIEGFNIADLSWGTANAKTVTLSFWVRSSLTGTFGGSLRNGNADRSYPFSYTINSANTWEYETITIDGDTTGTWATNSSSGVSVNFSLGNGATVSNTAGAWVAGNFTSATGATSVVGTNGATLYITGVQLEKGTQATSFDYLSYGIELVMCQRYCCVLTSGGGNAGPYGGLYTTTAGRVWYKHPVTMRASPTLSGTSGTGTASLVGVGTANCTVANTFFLPEISTWDLTSLSTSSTLGLPLVYTGAGILSAEL